MWYSIVSGLRWRVQGLIWIVIVVELSLFRFLVIGMVFKVSISLSGHILNFVALGIWNDSSRGSYRH